MTHQECWIIGVDSDFVTGSCGSAVSDEPAAGEVDRIGPGELHPIEQAAGVGAAAEGAFDSARGDCRGRVDGPRRVGSSRPAGREDPAVEMLVARTRKLDVAEPDRIL